MSSQALTTLSPLILDVEPGIGTIKSAFPAHSAGHSTPTKSVFQYQTNANLMTIVETVCHATKDMMLIMEPAFTLPLIMLSLQIQDAVTGIGTTKCV